MSNGELGNRQSVFTDFGNSAYFPISDCQLPIFLKFYLACPKNCQLAIGNWNCTHCHLKIFNATTKLTTNHAPRIAKFIQFIDNDAPSFIVERSNVLSAVNGNALMNG